MDSQAVEATAAASAANAARPSAHQPLRAAVVKATELVRAAEERARDKQRAKNKKTTRERLNLFPDTDTFEEIGCFQGDNIAGDNAGAVVITGFGQVYGRRVAVYVQDLSVKDGTLDTAEGEKICRLMDMAINLKVPIVVVVDSGGVRIQEGVAALTQYDRIFRKTCEADGFMPQLSLIPGPCTGGAACCPALTDLIIITRKSSNMSVIGPGVIRTSTGGTISMVDLDDGEVHNRVSGVAHYPDEDESDAIDYARTVLAYLLSNSESKPPVYAYAVIRTERETAKRLATIVPTNKRQPCGMLEVIRCVVDYDEFAQVQELFGAPALVGFACIDSEPVGIVTNQPNVLVGILDVDSSEKVARFARLCDAFDLPVTTPVDVPGYKLGSDQEHAGIIRRGAKVIYAYASAQIPMVTVVLHEAFGGAYIVMGSKTIGADLNFTWPSSQIAMLGTAGAVNTIHHHDLAKARASGQDVDALQARYIKEYEISTINANLSLGVGQADGMVDPEQTREVIVESLATLAIKQRVKRTTKHHSNQPL